MRCLSARKISHGLHWRLVLPLDSYSTQRLSYTYYGRRPYSSKAETCGDNLPSKNREENSYLKPEELNGTSQLTVPKDGTPLRCTKDQWLYYPSDQEVELFRKSGGFPTRPLDAEGSVIVRLVDLNRSVTSPVGRSIFYSEYGIRKGEYIRVLIVGAIFCGAFCYLGRWQLLRRDWKHELLQRRKFALEQPLVSIDTFSDVDHSLLLLGGAPMDYRRIECKGILDTSCKILVGPRSSLYQTYGDSSGYNVVCPLRFKDGSCVLVNMGWLGNGDAMKDLGFPELVTVRGVLVKGEISESLKASMKVGIINIYRNIMSSIFGRQCSESSTYVNRPSRLIRNDTVMVYTYFDPASISQQVYSRYPTMIGKYGLNAYDVLYHDDLNETSTQEGKYSAETSQTQLRTTSRKNVDSVRPYYQRRQVSDYLLFYADPETHLNYAAQWFLMAASTAGMCAYKLYRIRRTLKVAF
ncbi:hypothetical protein BgAZ_300060 [Babesia gibsoni]|uniref:SURF1-like protein n=1 Tax=Babesia gibsoni TaxID=33632 RepID=A0AAD8PCT3_BABGI|nr:hypothetical protein BgAZ_300060 [Babesia gibsoni]